jgi:hypothetical protein
LPEIIDNSIDVEQHIDYKKGGGDRSSENGVDNSNVLVHRLYGAIKIDGQIYRVKTTLKEFSGKDKSLPYDYRVTKLELLISGSEASDALSNSNVKSLKTISSAKLLNGVEKSYDKGVKLLDASENAASDRARLRFIGEKGAARLDAHEEGTTRLDNLAVAREMETAGKDAKAIKLATGWERGADGKWRYETADFTVKQETLPMTRAKSLRDKCEELAKREHDYQVKIDRLNYSRSLFPGRNRTPEQKEKIKDIDKQLKSLYKQRNAIAEERMEMQRTHIMLNLAQFDSLTLSVMTTDFLKPILNFMPLM